MAEVLFASDPRWPGEVRAIKRILPKHAADVQFRRFFAAEAELTCQLRHPNVISTLSAGEADGTPFLVMEYLHGLALNRILMLLAKQGKRLPVPYAAYIGMKALEGVHYVHDALDREGQPMEIVLCDVSPSNIMVGYAGEVKVIDFGIATSRVRFLEQLGTFKGKKHYMAPEQLRGDTLDRRTDIFALGLCLFEMLSGQPTFAQLTVFETEEAIRSGRIPSLADRAPHLPPALVDVVGRALRVEKAERFSTAADFAAALQPFTLLGKGGRQIGPEALARTLGLFVAPQKREDDSRLREVLEGESEDELPEVQILSEDEPTGTGQNPHLTPPTLSRKS
jgi:eukaryotic-like serine/threonine-protein kinase